MIGDETSHAKLDPAMHTYNSPIGSSTVEQGNKHCLRTGHRLVLYWRKNLWDVVYMVYDLVGNALRVQGCTFCNNTDHLCRMAAGPMTQ